MTVKERILLLKLMAKQKERPEVFEKLGIKFLVNCQSKQEKHCGNDKGEN